MKLHDTACIYFSLTKLPDLSTVNSHHFFIGNSLVNKEISDFLLLVTLKRKHSSELLVNNNASITIHRLTE